MLPDDLRFAGWIGGPVAWGASQLAGHVASPWICAVGAPSAATAITAAGLAAALGSAYLSWRAVRVLPSRGDPDPAAERRTGRFVAAAGVGIALLFAFALVLQAASGLVLTGCER
jgi:hypothetical protein